MMRFSIFAFRIAATVLPVVLVTGCASEPALTQAGQTERGYASWYGSENGTTTASGERFNLHALTAAHLSLPFGSVVRVTNEQNGRSVDVRINDRGPFTGDHRIIDVSSAAADELGMKTAGIVPVDVQVISIGDGHRVD